jgi:hypothetical protein
MTLAAFQLCGTLLLAHTQRTLRRLTDGLTGVRNRNRNRNRIASSVRVGSVGTSRTGPDRTGPAVQCCAVLSHNTVAVDRPIGAFGSQCGKPTKTAPIRPDQYCGSRFVESHGNTWCLIVIVECSVQHNMPTRRRTILRRRDDHKHVCDVFCFRDTLGVRPKPKCFNACSTGAIKPIHRRVACNSTSGNMLRGISHARCQCCVVCCSHLGSAVADSVLQVACCSGIALSATGNAATTYVAHRVDIVCCTLYGML